jgi:dTDP-4-dehydrorhamnose reductase
MEKKILLLGSNGQLGTFASHVLPVVGDTINLSFPKIDFTEPAEVCAAIEAIQPDIVYNAVAYTNVDQAEDDHEICTLVNATTPGEIGRLSKKMGFLLVHFSTDFVFDGRNRTVPYTEVDLPGPINVYGRTKLDGEQMIQHTAEKYFIFRTSWLYSKKETSFVGKALRWARNHETLRIVDDQFGSPTSAFDLSLLTTMAIKFALDKDADWIRKNSGIYHLGGDGAATRFEWVNRILSLDPNSHEQIVKEILPVKSTEFPTKAQRPTYSALNCTKFRNTFGLSLPNWEESLRYMMSMVNSF